MRFPTLSSDNTPSFCGLLRFEEGNDGFLTRRLPGLAVLNRVLPLAAWLYLLVSVFCASAQGEIDQFSDTRPLTISANIGYTYKQKDTEIWLLRGNCTLGNGSTYYVESGEMVLWIDCDENRLRQGKNGCYRLIAFMKGEVYGKLIRVDAANVSPEFRTNEWLGAFYNYVKPRVLVNYERNTPGDLPELYWTGLRLRQLQSQNKLDSVTSLNYALAQYETPGASTVPQPQSNAASDRKTSEKEAQKDASKADGKEEASTKDNKNADAAKSSADDAKPEAAIHSVALPASISGPVGQSAADALNAEINADGAPENAAQYTLPARIPSTRAIQELTQSEQGSGPLCPTDVSGAMTEGFRQLQIYSRADVPLDFEWKTANEGWIGVGHSGYNIVVKGAPGGTLDILTDKIIIWYGDANKPDTGNSITHRANIPMEFYLEGNIVFRQGERTMYAHRMYYDVLHNSGIVKDSELLTPVPNYQGLLRVRAETLQQLGLTDFYAKNAFVTSSRMGEPSYRMELSNLMVHDQLEPKVDPYTLLPITDEHGEPVYNHAPSLEGTDIKMYAGNIPIFAWPVVSTQLDRSTLYIDQLQFKTDSIFGFQAWSTWNAYELLGLKHPLSGTKWTIDIDPLSKRGIGHGTDFEFSRYLDQGLFSGPIQGNIDFWGIYDWGNDNLGFERKKVKPEEKYRYKMIGGMRHDFGRNLELTSQIGWLSDRDFMPEYFEDDWYTKDSPHTGLMLRQQIDNMSWDVAADLKINDFYTETQQLPRFDHFWIGESLLADRLTWYTHTTAGYYQLKSGSLPTAPENMALYGSLPWEDNCSSGRFTTRHELDCPLQAGPVKLVPYILGEAGYWGDSPSGDAFTRLYGQAGVRASIPIWKTNPNVCSQLWNLHGLAHKVSFEAEWYVGSSDTNMEDLPLYDALDDQSITQYRHLIQATTFGTMLPWKYDPRSYALRSGLGNSISSPGIEILDDLNVVRLGINQRWQTHRGPVGFQNTIDWITFNAGFSLFPDSDRDNFGKLTGLWNYDFRWHVGDRFSVLSSGLYDTIPGGIRAWSLGGQLEKPGQGSVYLGLYTLGGPVENTVLTVQADYWLSPKWQASFVSDFDIMGQGNIGQRLNITRVGESLLVRCGFYVDATRDDFGVSLTIEPRFLSKGSLSRKLGVSPTGAYGLE